MLSIFNTKIGALRISRILVFDVIAVVVITGLIMRNVIPPRGAGIAYLMLLLANFAVILMAARKQTHVIEQPARIPRGLWFVPFPFTAAAVIEIIVWVRNPSLFNTGQAVAGTILAGCFWFLLHRLNRRKTNHAGRE